jgi:hypothetical protein
MPQTTEINAFNAEIALPRGFVTPHGNWCPLEYHGAGMYEVAILAEEKYAHAPSAGDRALLAVKGQAV